MNLPSLPFMPLLGLCALTACASAGELLRPLARPESPVPAFSSGFRIDRDQTIVIFGGANAAECQRNGWLETRLISAHPNHRLRLRNLAWPTDTVYRQSRPRNFFSVTPPDYGEKDGRVPLHADLAFLWFGQMESLAGRDRLPDFRAAYDDLVDQLSAYTRRIVLVTPAPFEDPLGLGFDLPKRNGDLAGYAAAIREIAARRRLPVVDLTSALKGQTVTADGVMLSEAGHQAAALTFAQQLGMPRQLPPFTNYVRETIREKNVFWQRYWLPSNWAFLYGNRQSQPSSRDHANPKERWFPGEVAAILPLVEKLEAEIQDKVRTE